MNVMEFHTLLISLIVAYIGDVSCVNINAVWPYIDSIPFPYPTDGPIDIISSEARPVITPLPLKFKVNPFQQAYVNNTGSSLVVTSTQQGLGRANGGILYDDKYFFFQCEFYWDKSLTRSAGVKIDGEGAHLVVAASFFNTKYGNYDNAKRKRDGIAQIVILIDVVQKSNLLFYPFESALQKVLQANSTTPFSEFAAYNWYFTPSSTNFYYAYPGQYQNPFTKEIFYSSTVMVPKRTPRPSISRKQFDATFASLKNYKGKAYSNIKETVDKGRRPVVVANGLQLILNL